MMAWELHNIRHDFPSVAADYVCNRTEDYISPCRNSQGQYVAALRRGDVPLTIQVSPRPHPSATATDAAIPEHSRSEIAAFFFALGEGTKFKFLARALAATGRALFDDAVPDNRGQLTFDSHSDRRSFRNVGKVFRSACHA